VGFVGRWRAGGAAPYASLAARDFVDFFRFDFVLAAVLLETSSELAEDSRVETGSGSAVTIGEVDPGSLGGSGSDSRAASVSPETAGAAASGAYGGGAKA
jgi:hypothetical protein